MSTLLEQNKDFRDSQLPKWEKMILALFDDEIPERKEFTRKSEIRKILKKIGKNKASNHTFMPDSGGLDLTSCHKSEEKGCIELDFDGIPNIVKPSKLVFQSFPGVSSEWSYFYLTVDGLEPSGIYDEYDMEYEELTEIKPGEYINRSYFEHGEYEGQRLPESARVVIRYFKGSYVIFSKASIYNLAEPIDAYNAPHQKMGEEKFKEYITHLSKKLK